LNKITDVFQTFILACKVKVLHRRCRKYEQGYDIYVVFIQEAGGGLWSYINYFMNIDPSKYLLRLLMDLIQGTSNITYFLHQLPFILKRVFFEGRLKADGCSDVELASNHFPHSYLAVRSTRSGKSIKDPFALIRFQILSSS